MGAYFVQAKLERVGPAIALAVVLGTPLHASAEWRVRRPSFDPRAIGRYETLLARDPDNRYALGKLVELHRRHARLPSLISSYRARAKRRPRRLAPRLVLAHLLRLTGKPDEAISAYEIAASIDPRREQTFAYLAELHRRRDNTAAASENYQRALALGPSPARTKRYLRRLAQLASAAKQWPEAAGYLQRLVELAPRRLAARLDLATALHQGGDTTLAIVALRGALGVVTNTARRIDVLEQLAQLHRAAGQSAAALAAYRRILRLTSSSHWRRRDTLRSIMAVYRERDELSELLALWRHKWRRRGFLQWDLLAQLAEQTGDDDGAIKAYRAALKKRPADIDTRLRLVAIFDRQGQPKAALREYRGLARAARSDPDHQLELARRLRRIGHHSQASAALARCVARFRRNVSVRAAAADLWLQWGDEARALRESKVLVRLAPHDESYLLRLGELQFIAGRRRAARKTWRRLLRTIPQRHRALARLAAVYAQHDMVDESIALYREAVGLAPSTPRYRRDLAFVLERARKHAAALEQWNQLSSIASSRQDDQLGSECRRRIIDLLASTHQLKRAMRDYEARFAGRRPDVPAGLLLAQAHIKLRNPGAAIQVLERVITSAPARIDALQTLQQLYRTQRQVGRSVTLLERLAELQPSRAQRYYRQISEAKLHLLDDDGALDYAKRAAEASALSPSGFERLADVFVARGDYPGARGSLEHALQLAPGAQPVRLRLAELHGRHGHHEQALRQLRHVLTHTIRPELARRAFDSALPTSQLLAQTEGLERVLLRRCLGQGQLAQTYRALLLRLYERRVPALIRAGRDPAPLGRAAARTRLAKIGRRGVAPLLALLAAPSTPSRSRRRAADMLGLLANVNATTALLRAAGRRPTPLPRSRGAKQRAHTRPASYAAQARASSQLAERVAALVALGRLAVPSSGPSLARLARSNQGPVQELALWALARAGGGKAAATFRRATQDRRVSAQLLACVGLGAHGSSSDKALVRTVLGDTDRAPTVRAGCAWAAGLLGDDAAAQILVAATASGHEQLAASATAALGRLGDSQYAPLLFRLSFSDRASLRRAAMGALLSLGGQHKPTRTLVPVVQLAGVAVDLPAFVASLVDSQTASAGQRARVRLLSSDGARRDVVLALRGLLARQRGTVLRVLERLRGSGGRPALSPWTDDLAGVPPALRVDLERSVRAIVGQLVEPLATLARSADPLVRARAGRILGFIDDPAAHAALARLVHDKEALVQDSALLALGRSLPLHQGAADQISQWRVELHRLATGRIDRRRHWRVREAAVRLLARLAPQAAASDLAAAVLDPSGFVRQAAAHALRHLAGQQRGEMLAALLADTVPQVRIAACKTVGYLRYGRLESVVERLQFDPDPRVQRAARAVLGASPSGPTSLAPRGSSIGPG